MCAEHEENRTTQHRDLMEHFGEFVAEVQDYAIFLMSPEGNILTWNRGAERLKGYRADEIIGSNFSRFYPPEVAATGFPQEELVIAAKEGRFEGEGWRIRKDGSQFWANVIITAVRHESGEPRGFLKITRDLTERREAEIALRDSEERFRLVVQGVKDYAIFMLDPEGHVLSWNAGAEHIKGYTAQEIIGKHFSAFYSSEDLAAGKPARELREAIARGSVEDEGWRVRKDRSQFWANVVITALYDEKGTHRGFAKVTRDMTDRIRIDELQHADRQKNQFLAMLAHELRNPLAPIRNGLELLRMPGVDEVTVRETTDVMERQIVHLVRLVDDLLDVSRIVTGKIVLVKEPVDLGTVLTRAIEETQPLFDARGHELMVTLPARATAVSGDIVRLAQVFSNLLTNAAKYSEKPSQVWLTVEREHDEAVIKVRDTGVGIAREVLPNVFNLFVQADNTLARTQGGLGIGLTLVKRIVELHGGSVGVTSLGLGEGTEFTVRLPLSHERPATGGPSRPTETKPLSQRRILVVDDNVDAAMTVVALLKKWGHEVQVTFNGTSALEAVRNFRPEIILLDIGLPGMSGYDVARHLRAEPTAKNLFIAALTGYGQEDDRRRSKEAGFDCHLTKPPDPGVLQTLLASPRNFALGLPPVENN